MVNKYKVPQQQEGIVVLECLVNWDYDGGCEEYVNEDSDGKDGNPQDTTLILSFFSCGRPQRAHPLPGVSAAASNNNQLLESSILNQSLQIQI